MKFLLSAAASERRNFNVNDLGRSAVEHNSEVGAGGARVANKVSVGTGGDGLLNLGVVVVGEGRPELGSNTSNVRSSHRGTRDGVGALSATDPSGGDASAGGEDLAAGAEGREGRSGISGVSGHDGVGKLSRSGGRVAGVVVGVSSSNNHDEAGAKRGISGIVDGLVAATSERHVADDLAASAGNIGGPVNTSNDTSKGSRAVRAQDLDSDGGSFTGKTESSTDRGGGDVGSVAVTIEEASVGGIEAEGASVLEVDVLAVDTGVDDVNFNSSAGGGSSAQLVGLLSNRGGRRDGSLNDGTGKTPGVRGGKGLAGLESASNHVGLNVLDIRVSSDHLGLISGQTLDGVALEITNGVGVHGVGAVDQRAKAGHVVAHVSFRVQDDNPFARNDLGTSGGTRVIDGEGSSNEASNNENSHFC